MIRLCLVLLLNIFFPLTTCQASDDAQQFFTQANALYKEGNFQEAMEAYEKIPNKSALVLYNLGNCAYKLQEYGIALLNWRRAEKHWGFFNRDELIDNITLLKEKLRVMRGGKTEARSPVSLAAVKIKNLVISSFKSIPLLLLQIIFLLLWLFLFVYIRFLYKKRKKAVVVTLFGFIAFFGIILAVRYNVEARTCGVITSSQAPLLSGPEKTFQTLMNLQQAQEVVIKGESGDYFKVRVFWQTGWTHKEHVGVV